MVVVEALQALLGPDRVQTDPETLSWRSIDTWPLRLLQRVAGAEPARPLCVVRPRSTAEVAAACAYLYQAAIPMVPYGGGSGVAGGAEPGAKAVVLDLSELDLIVSLDEENLLVTAQCGVVLGRLEAWLNERGYVCGHYPQSVDLAQLGGLVATRSAGQFSTRYGNIEDLVAGLEVVLPDGRVIRCTHNAPRRSAGPDLKQIWLGSEGTLGVITEVTLKVFPKPAARWMQAYALPSMGQGLKAMQQFMRDGWRPAVVRLHDATEAERSYPGVPGEGEAILLLLSEGPQGYVDAEAQALAETLSRKARALGPEPVEHWLAHRNDVRLFGQLIEMGILVDTIEVAAGWNAIGAIYEQVTARLRAEIPELLAVSGHASHCYPQGTNLYFTLAAQPAPDPAEVERVYRAIWERAMDTTLSLGGTICHHHGIGKLRTPWLAQELGTAYPVLKAVKGALDPRGLANPGTLLP